MNSRLTPELLAKVLEEHGAALSLFAAQWTDSPDDCVQEALLQLARQPVIPERLLPWLYRVVRNQAISWQRSAKRRTRRETAVAKVRPSWFVAPTEGAIDQQQLTEVLRSLPDSHREIILARVWGGLTFEQIAEVVGTSRSSAHRYYEEGIEILRDKLGVPCLNSEKSPK